MSNQARKPTFRKLASSSSSSSRSQPSVSESQVQTVKNRPIYPEMAKRDARKTSSSSTINFEEPSNISIDTESQIFFTQPTSKMSNNNLGSSLTTVSSHENQQRRRQLELISKYTSSAHGLDDFNIGMNSAEDDDTTICTNSQPTIQTKAKRCLSPVNEMTGSTAFAAKRRKSVQINRDNSDDENDDEAEIIDFLDHRQTKRRSYRAERKTRDSKTNNETSRKSNLRRSTRSKQNQMSSRAESNENENLTSSLLIEIDNDSDIEEQVDSCDLTVKSLQTNQNSKTSGDLSSLLVSKKSFDEEVLFSTVSSTAAAYHEKTHSSSNACLNSTVDESMCTSTPQRENGRQTFSSNSSNFETPCSSICHFLDNSYQMSSSTPSKQNGIQTETERFTTNDLIRNLLLETGVHKSVHQSSVDFDPKEIAERIFKQVERSNENESSQQQTAENGVKQYLSFGRYEMEVLHPIDLEKMISKIYACDLCLKHFNGSKMAKERHALKCLQTSPPGRLIFSEKDVAIFCIGERGYNREQRIYIDNLRRIADLFCKPNKRHDERRSNEFIYYILCRRDPILYHSQTYRYRFVGYFSRCAEQWSINLCCLFILAPFADREEYSQLLIAFSYFLTQSNRSRHTGFSSPARPMNDSSFLLFTNYCYKTIVSHLSETDRSIALENLSRQTSIDPRDILFTLQSNGKIYADPDDDSLVHFIKSESMSNECSFDRWKNTFREVDLGKTQESNEHEQFEEILLE